MLWANIPNTEIHNPRHNPIQNIQKVNPERGNLPILPVLVCLPAKAAHLALPRLISRLHWPQITSTDAQFRRICQACTYYSDIKVCDQSTTGIKGKSPMLFASCYYIMPHVPMYCLMPPCTAPCPHVLPHAPMYCLMSPCTVTCDSHNAILRKLDVFPNSARQHVPDQSGRLSLKFISRFVTLSTLSSLGLGAGQCRMCCRDLHSSPL